MLEDIKGIGPKTLKLFQNLNIFTIQDLITYYPYKYKLYHPVTLDNYEENTEVLINGYVASDAKIYYIKRNLNKKELKDAIQKYGDPDDSYQE